MNQILPLYCLIYQIPFSAGQNSFSLDSRVPWPLDSIKWRGRSSFNLLRKCLWGVRLILCANTHLQEMTASSWQVSPASHDGARAQTHSPDSFFPFTLKEPSHRLQHLQTMCSDFLLTFLDCQILLLLMLSYCCYYLLLLFIYLLICFDWRKCTSLNMYLYIIVFCAQHITLETWAVNNLLLFLPPPASHHLWTAAVYIMAQELQELVTRKFFNACGTAGVAT